MAEQWVAERTSDEARGVFERGKFATIRQGNRIAKRWLQPLSTTLWPGATAFELRSTGVSGVGVLGPSSSYLDTKSRRRPLKKGSFAFSTKSHG